MSGLSVRLLIQAEKLEALSPTFLLQWWNGTEIKWKCLYWSAINQIIEETAGKQRSQHTGTVPLLWNCEGTTSLEEQTQPGGLITGFSGSWLSKDVPRNIQWIYGNAWRCGNELEKWWNSERFHKRERVNRFYILTWKINLLFTLFINKN